MNTNAQNKLQHLQEAVDFFSQSLHIEQLMFYGYELVHKALQLKRSALFMLDASKLHYELKRQFGYEIEYFVEPATSQHAYLAKYMGGLVTKNLEKYLSQSIISTFESALVMPIIVKDELVGFLVSDGHGNDQDLDMSFIKALNQLMNTAYENAQNTRVLSEKNAELDRRIFTLQFVNHCSRLLMAELRLDMLYNLCIDVVRELTSSVITAFFLYDAPDHVYKLRGYKNVKTFDTQYAEIRLNPTFSENPKARALTSDQIVYCLDQDRHLIDEIFTDSGTFEKMQAQYVILIIKDSLLGFVTVSKPLNGKAYDQHLVQMIGAVANTIYIAISNAKAFEALKGEGPV